jgi:hypothetical protein
MKYLEWLTIGIVIIFILYIILKIIGKIQDNQYDEEENYRPTPKDIEIVSRDLYIKSENLLAMIDIYELQLAQLKHEIADIEGELNVAKSLKQSENAKMLTGRSLRLQERKCIIEAKIIKTNDELAKIALEEYRRQMM